MMGAFVSPLLGLIGLFMAKKQGDAAVAAQDRATQAAREMAQQQEARAIRTEKAAVEAQNRVNQKKPDVGAILDQARQAGKGGASGTMLTGPMGVAPSDLTLGKKSLLGE